MVSWLGKNLVVMRLPTYKLICLGDLRSFAFLSYQANSAAKTRRLYLHFTSCTSWAKRCPSSCSAAKPWCSSPRLQVWAFVKYVCCVLCVVVCMCVRVRASVESLQPSAAAALASVVCRALYLAHGTEHWQHLDVCIRHGHSRACRGNTCCCSPGKRKWGAMRAWA